MLFWGMIALLALYFVNRLLSAPSSARESPEVDSLLEEQDAFEELWTREEMARLGSEEMVENPTDDP